MRIEVRSISSLKIVPESDSDRAVLRAMTDMGADKSKVFCIQSSTWCLEQQEIVVGFNEYPGHVGRQDLTHEREGK
jgi:hypothetical protein